MKREELRTQPRAIQMDKQKSEIIENGSSIVSRKPREMSISQEKWPVCSYLLPAPSETLQEEIPIIEDHAEGEGALH